MSSGWNPQRWELWNPAALGPSPAGWPGMTGMTDKLPQLLRRTQFTTLRHPPGETVTIPNLWERCSAWGWAPSLSSPPPPCDEGPASQGARAFPSFLPHPHRPCQPPPHCPNPAH